MKYSFIAIMALLFMSCNSNDIEPLEPLVEVDYTAQNEATIKAYIAENKLDAKRTNSGLYYVITDEGTGEHPVASSNITVAYKGYFTDKKIFDQSLDTGIRFDLSGVIKGWREGIPYFKEGGSGILLIPAHLAYGSFDYRGIPGGSVLIFNVNLISINN